MLLQVAILFLCSATLCVAESPEEFQGEPWTHDPSTIIKCKSEYWVFATGRGILSRRSPDLQTWRAGPRIYSNAPAWTTNAVPANRGILWAPDIIEISNRYLLYYAVSSWGSQTSAIGLASNPTLDPGDPNYGWTDKGLVIRSSPRENFNAIDPSVMRDHEGRLWLAFGSYWSGIKLVELDPTTGLRRQTNSTIYALAWKNAIEAASMHEHEGWFYLLVNWDHCCLGTNSTYNIRVGRSRAVTGPYLDKDGVDMLKGGGSLLLGRQGRLFGPGHAGFLTDRGTNWFSFHYYDGERQGAATLAVRRLSWDSGKWPVVERR